MHSIWEKLQPWLGLGVEPNDLLWHQMLLRAVAVFFATLVMVRVADKRFMAKRTAFDYVLGLILASVLARAVNGSAAFFSTLLTGFLLVFLHRALGVGAYHSKLLCRLIKGTDQVLVQDGKVNKAAMESNHIRDGDLEEDLRLDGGTDAPEHVECARIERDGEISIIKKPSVHLIEVKDGVQVLEVRVRG